MASVNSATLFTFDQLESIQTAMLRRYPADVIARFWTKVTFTEPCACHVWEDRCTGWADALRNGYGAFSVTGQDWYTHRFLWDALFGPLSRYDFVLHVPPCLVRACVRHLYMGTPKQNTLDAQFMDRLARGERNGRHLYPERGPRGANHPARLHPEMHQGERNGRATITQAMAQAILDDRARGMTGQQLVEKYVVGTSCISHLIAGHTWKHLS